MHWNSTDKLNTVLEKFKKPLLIIDNSFKQDNS